MAGIKLNKKRVAVGCMVGMLLMTGCNGTGVSGSKQRVLDSTKTKTETTAESNTESNREANTEANTEADASVTESETQVTMTTRGDKVATKELFAMDTYMTLTAYGDNGKEAVEQAAEEIKRLDAALSTGSEDSVVTKLNDYGGGNLTEDTKYLLEKSMELYTDTEGLFDIAIYPVMEAWGFPTQNFRVPEESELTNLLALADVSKIQYDQDAGTVSFGEEGMKIDFGGIAKGYTSSRIMKIYEKAGVTSGLVNLGGNVQALGTKPDGSKWKVGIQDPEGKEDYLGTLSIKDKAVITSGGYERYFEQDGKTYHHIIDPRTGYPADSGLLSVTIVSSDGTLADGLSTSLFIMGKDQAVEFWREHSGEFDAIIEEEDGSLYVTEGIAEEFEAKGHKVTVVEK